MEDIVFKIISIICTAVLLPLFSLFGSYLIKHIKTIIKNNDERKKLEELKEIITSTVNTIYQTYVEDLKCKDRFTVECHIKALEKAKKMILCQISEEKKIFILDKFGNIDVWLETKIESYINSLKQNKKNP